MDWLIELLYVLCFQSELSVSFHFLFLSILFKYIFISVISHESSLSLKNKLNVSLSKNMKELSTNGHLHVL